jgi:arginine exporter protein ArgO
MTLSNVLLGLTIGLPMMIAVGPISVLLLDQGLERGTRTAAPAALGVATADLTLSSLAAVGGTVVSRALAPVQGAMVLVAVGVLAWLAVGMARGALTELRRARVVPSAAAPQLVAAGAAPGEPAATAVVEPVTPAEPELAGEPVAVIAPAPSVAFAHQHGLRLAGTFFGLTLVNPLTLVLFASVVVAGGAGVGSIGWAAGMALASLVAHGAFVVLGGVLGTTLGAAATARLRLGAAAFMAALAVHFLLAA